MFWVSNLDFWTSNLNTSLLSSFFMVLFALWGFMSLIIFTLLKGELVVDMDSFNFLLFIFPFGSTPWDAYLLQTLILIMFWELPLYYSSNLSGIKNGSWDLSLMGLFPVESVWEINMPRFAFQFLNQDFQVCQYYTWRIRRFNTFLLSR